MLNELKKKKKKVEEQVQYFSASSVVSWSFQWALTTFFTAQAAVHITSAEELGVSHICMALLQPAWLWGLLLCHLGMEILFPEP